MSMYFINKLNKQSNIGEDLYILFQYEFINLSYNYLELNIIHYIIEI